MGKAAVILCLVVLQLKGAAQVYFKASGQQQRVEAGRSFSVEYLLEESEENKFFAPAFPGLKIVDGPARYKAHIPGRGPAANYVFTLVATRPGRYTIPAARAIVNGKEVYSNELVIEVIERAEPGESDYYLRPGEDPYEKIRKNLFVRVHVNKRSCYVGEPVVATFKLYSRLQSKSDIVKNPGFYGFSVQDIIGLNDEVSSTESVNGRLFDVHTVRTVQLYPLRPGIFFIDPMEIENEVEFSKSVVNIKTEQEIVEGRFEKRSEPKTDRNKVIIEYNLSTGKIDVKVKPLPPGNKPPSFNGATGRFTIDAALQESGLSVNEQGRLVISIHGQGNFTQLYEPVVQWPESIESFGVTVTDSIDKKHVPLQGTRSFSFPFAASKAGVHRVPGVIFSFFDIDSNKYKTVSTAPILLQVQEKNEPAAVPAGPGHDPRKSKETWLYGLAALVLAAGIAFWIWQKKNSKAVSNIGDGDALPQPGIDELLAPAGSALEKNDRHFYSILQQAIWKFLGQRLHLSGSQVNKADLLRRLNQKNVPADSLRDILAILQECEAAAFTRAEFMHDKQELLAKTREALLQVESNT